jgi:tetratricopeptide (TPR) repeat protein
MSIENQIQEAQSFFKGRQFPEAEEILLNVLESNPDNHDAQLGYALVLLMQHKADESWHYLKLAQKTNPENPKVYRAIAMLMRMTGAVDQAISYLQLQITTSPLLINPLVHVTLAQLYATIGDAEAIQTLLEFLQHLPLTEEKNQYWLYIEIEDAEGLESLGKRSQLDGFLNLCLGSSAHLRGDKENSLQYLRWAIEQNNTLWEAHLGLAKYGTGSISQDLQHIRKALSLAPQTAEVHITHAELLIRSNQKDDGRNIAHKMHDSTAVFKSIRDRAQTILSLDEE